jgi:hypothetical protein
MAGYRVAEMTLPCVEPVRIQTDAVPGVAREKHEPSNANFSSVVASDLLDGRRPWNREEFPVASIEDA